MSVRIYVGNLNYRTEEGALRTLFEPHGEVEEVAIIMDRETGRPRGFAFVTMADDQAAQDAIAAVNGQEFEGRVLNVNEAKPKVGGGGGGGGFRSGGGGGFRGGNSGGGGGYQDEGGGKGGGFKGGRGERGDRRSNNDDRW